MIRRVRELILAGVTLALPLIAHAENPNVAAADEVYKRGAAAYDRGDYAAAASEFARADKLAPSLTALQFALKAALKADDPILAMSLVERAQKREVALSSLVSDLRKKFGPRVGQIVVECDDSCSATVDGEDVSIGERRWIVIGRHHVEIESSGSTEHRTVTITPEQLVTVSASEPRPSKPKNEREDVRRDTTRHGVSPTFFWIGVGATAFLGAVTVASGIDTRSKHDSFSQSPSETKASDGRSAQTRTNVLLVGTAVFAVATGALGVFVVDW